ncbi:Uncharacterised protein [Raoultella ornithinolytica]|nr:Uncharacterised protein [Raoultella ornithinolytica]
MKLDPQPGKGLRQHLRQKRKEQRAHRGHQTNTHGTIAAGRDNLFHVMKRQLGHAQHAPGVRQNGGAQFGQRDRRGGAVHQLAAQHRFDLPQGAAQRRLADSQTVGGIGKMTQLRQGNKVL